MTEELKPCPFCGSNAVDTEMTPIVSLGICLHRWVCLCSDCDGASQALDSEGEAIVAWNTRPAEDALAAEVERLRALVELAYREGVADGPWWGAAWATSKARAALAHPAKEAGDDGPRGRI